MQDSSAAPLSAMLVVNILVTDVNDLAVTALAVAPASVAADLGANMNNASSPYFGTATLGAYAVLLRAAGGAQVVLSGLNFGLTPRRMLAESRSPSVTSLNVTYGPPPLGNQYVATGCSVSAASNTMLTCTSAPSCGEGHVWVVRVANAVPGAVLESGSGCGVRCSGYRLLCVWRRRRGLTSGCCSCPPASPPLRSWSS